MQCNLESEAIRIENSTFCLVFIEFLKSILILKIVHKKFEFGHCQELVHFHVAYWYRT